MAVHGQAPPRQRPQNALLIPLSRRLAVNSRGTTLLQGYLLVTALAGEVKTHLVPPSSLQAYLMSVTQ